MLLTILLSTIAYIGVGLIIATIIACQATDKEDASNHALLITLFWPAVLCGIVLENFCMLVITILQFIFGPPYDTKTLSYFFKKFVLIFAKK